MQHIYVPHSCGSLPNKLYRIGFELFKLHASIYLALSVVTHRLDCAVALLYMCTIRVYLQDKPASRVWVRYLTLNVQNEHVF